MSKHTPGNWLATPEPSGLEWSVTADDWYVCCCAEMPSEGMARANARLISSAPDLLNVLKMIGNVPCPEDVFKWLSESGILEARAAAIAKATGND